MMKIDTNKRQTVTILSCDFTDYNAFKTPLPAVVAVRMSASWHPEWFSTTDAYDYPDGWAHLYADANMEVYVYEKYEHVLVVEHEGEYSQSVTYYVG